MKYFKRILLEEIKKWIDRREIIAIKGPRQSGKTTLLEMLREWLIKKGVNKKSIVFVTFEDREMLEAFQLNPKEFVKRFARKGKTYFMIDEAHYCKDIGQKLKLLYDTNKNIKFIITGSSSLEITSHTAKYLVGRLFSFELLPFNFYEFLNAKDKGLAKIYLEKHKLVNDFIFKGKDFVLEKEAFIKEFLNYLNEYLIFGGYPEVIKGKTEEEKRIILKNIFNTYLEKDIISYLHITDTIKFRRLVSMLAFNISGLLSYEKLASGCNSYFKEIIHLLDILQQTYIIKLLRPFHKNLVTELRKNPKVYFFDFGLRNYIINNFNPLDLRGDIGKLAENFVLNQLQNEHSINFWRTTAKAEVDFVLTIGNELIPVEVKFETFRKPKITKSMHSFIANYKPSRALIVTKDFYAELKLKKTLIKFVPIVYL
jgi:hypothetical protein